MVTVDQMNQLSDLELDIYNYIISHRHEVILRMESRNEIRPGR